MGKLEKVVTNENGMFQGYVTDDGIKVEGTDREFATKIAIGSALGRIIKTMPENPDAPVVVKNTVTESTPPVEEPSTMVKNETAPMEPTISVDTAIQEKGLIIGVNQSNGDDSTAVATFKDEEIVDVKVSETPVVKEQKMVVDDKATDRVAQRETYLTRLHKRVEETIQIDGVTVHVIDSNWASSIKYRHKAVEYSIEIVSPSEIFMSRTIDPALGVCYFDDHAPKLAKWINDGLSLEDTGHVIHNIEKLKFTQLIWNFSNYRIIAIKV